MLPEGYANEMAIEKFKAEMRLVPQLITAPVSVERAVPGKAVDTSKEEGSVESTALQQDTDAGTVAGEAPVTVPPIVGSAARLECPATTYHPMACSGPEAWNAWRDSIYLNHYDIWSEAGKTMGLTGLYYSDYSEADRSAFAYSVEDRIKWTANGMAVKGKKGRKR